MECSRPIYKLLEDVTLNPIRYIDIDSTYRNRTTWPDPAYFQVTSSPSNICQQMSGTSAQDPIVDGYPIYSFKGDVSSNSGNFTGGVPFLPALALSASSIDDIYRGLIINDTTTGENVRISSYEGSNKGARLLAPFSELWSVGDAYTISVPSTTSEVYVSGGAVVNDAYNKYYLVDVTTGESRKIVDYDALTQIVTLETPFSGAWNITDDYEIRPDANVLNSGAASAMTSNTITLTGAPAGISVDYYKGSFVKISDPNSLLYNESRVITAYDPITKIATIAPPFSQVLVAPIGYEVLQFSHDNSGCVDIQPTARLDSGYYEIGLLTLILPNVILQNYPGGRIAFYPYVYVEFGNSPVSNTNNILISNNPNSSRALFKCPIYDVPNPVISTFVKVTAAGMKHVIRFNPYEDYVFRVFLPDGTLYDVGPDSSPPQNPNPALQISATFSIHRLVPNKLPNTTPMMMR